jgi:uncharacterized membrane protein YphA (DoxX/SURF4 family)
MNTALWIIQALLALVFGAAGAFKVFQTGKAQQMMRWAKNRSDSFVRFVGTSEILGAAGLVLPMVTGVLPWLTLLAAFGLALIQILAIATEHLPRKEFSALPMNGALLAMSIFTLVGRWALMGF